MSGKIIAVDFDGTIVDDAYPKVGKAKMFAFETLKKLQKDGYRLNLWTYRSGKTLKDAVEFCKKNGLEFNAINNSFEGEEFEKETQSRKINADLFIDDRNIGGFPGWGEVYQIITKELEFKMEDALPVKKKKKGFFNF